MKINELTHEQLAKIADNRPEWMADNRPVWMADNRPVWMAYNRPELIVGRDVPPKILGLLAETN